MVPRLVSAPKMSLVSGPIGLTTPPGATVSEPLESSAPSLQFTLAPASTIRSPASAPPLNSIRPFRTNDGDKTGLPLDSVSVSVGSGTPGGDQFAGLYQSPLT